MSQTDLPPYGPAVAGFEFDSISHGYVMMNRAVKVAQVEILEGAFMVPGKFFLLINGEEAAVSTAYFDLIDSSSLAGSTNKMIDSFFEPKFSGVVLSSYFGLLKAEAQESLAILEATTLCRSLELTNQASRDYGIQPIEIRSSRGIGSKTLAFWTGPKAILANAIDSTKKKSAQDNRLLNIELISDPEPQFFEYFNLSGGYTG